MTGIIYAIISAAIWGAGDFCGGQAARRFDHYQVLALASSSGLAGLLALTVLRQEAFPSPAGWLWAMAAGAAGALGIATLYRGLALGNAALVSPVAGVIGAAIPALASAVLEGLPGPAQAAGFACGLAGIALVSSAPSSGTASRRSGLWLALLSGIAFGAFFILITRVDTQAVFAPLVIAKSIALLTALLALRLRGLKAIWPLPRRGAVVESTHARAVLIGLLTGVLDAGGNVFYLLASQNARLDIAAVLSSMYPASTVLLASLVQRERITVVQWLGVGFCLAAVALITV